MARWCSRILLLVILAVSNAPLVILVQFHLDRSRIARELCVQRDLVENMRTCHGECQLSKRLKALEEDAEAGIPMERIGTRFEPKVPLLERSELVVPSPIVRYFLHEEFLVLDGVVRCADHVPRT